MSKPGPPSRFPKQITPYFLPGTTAKIDAEARQTGLTPSTLVRMALEKCFPATGRQPQPPRILPSGKPGAAIQRVTRISDATYAQIENARARNGLKTLNEVVRHVVEQTYPPD